MKRMFDINKPPPHPYWCDDCGEKAPFTIPHTPIPHRKGCSRFNEDPIKVFSRARDWCIETKGSIP